MTKRTAADVVRDIKTGESGKLASVTRDEDGQRWLWCQEDGRGLCDELERLGVVADRAEDDGYVYRVVDAAALAGL